MIFLYRDAQSGTIAGRWFWSVTNKTISAQTLYGFLVPQDPVWIKARPTAYTDRLKETPVFFSQKKQAIAAYCGSDCSVEDEAASTDYANKPGGSQTTCADSSQWAYAVAITYMQHLWKRCAK